MKIKRFNNLWFMGLLLSAVILGAIYLLKIFMPQFVIEVAHIESIVRIGHYIDTHKWAWYLATFVFSCFSSYFYCAACCSRKTFKTKELMVIVAIVLCLFAVKEFFPIQYTNANVCSMIILPCILKGNFKNTAITFSVINTLQIMTLEIRNIGLLISDYNFATLMILMIDYYILIVLMYFYFNYKKGDK